MADQPAGEADTSVITAADIARENPARLVDLLKSRVGLDERNGYITMRGVEGIAVFVDGFSSSLGGLGSVKPEQVEKIEILRGAASARFGAEAMGGAIAVTTKKAAASSVNGNLTLGGDSRGGGFARVNASAGQGAWSAALLVESKYTHGFPITPDSPMPYQITVDDTRSRSRQADLKLAWRGERLEASLNVKHEEGWTSLGRPHWNFESRGQSLRFKALWQASEGVALEGAWGLEESVSPALRDQGTGTDAAGLAPAYRLTSDARQQEGTLALIWRRAGWQGRLGGTVSRGENHHSNTDVVSGWRRGADSILRNEALFASMAGPLGPGKLEADVRQDWLHYEHFRRVDGDAVTTGGGAVKTAISPKMALTWPLAGAGAGAEAGAGVGHTLRTSVGTGFSPPSAYFLYNAYVSPGTVNLPNPGLKPERSLTADLGWSARGSAGQWGATVFFTRWQDKIASRILDYGVPVVQQAQNVGEAAAYGIEAQWSRRFSGGWSANANATYSRTRVVRDVADPSLVGKELPDMPRYKANLALGYGPDDRFFARAKLRVVGSAFTDEANTVTDARGYRWKKSAYAVVDVAATWRRPGWEFNLALDNVFNRDYVQGFFWHGEPRTLRGELKFSF